MLEARVRHHLCKCRGWPLQLPVGRRVDLDALHARLALHLRRPARRCLGPAPAVPRGVALQRRRPREQGTHSGCAVAVLGLGLTAEEVGAEGATVLVDGV